MKVPSLSMVPGYQSPKEGEREREGEGEGEEGERQGERGRGRGRGREAGGEREERAFLGPSTFGAQKPKAENTLNSLFCLAVLFCTSFCNDNNLNADKRL